MNTTFLPKFGWQLWPHLVVVMQHKTEPNCCESSLPLSLSLSHSLPIHIAHPPCTVIKHTDFVCVCVYIEEWKPSSIWLYRANTSYILNHFIAYKIGLGGWGIWTNMVMAVCMCVWCVIVSANKTSLILAHLFTVNTQQKISSGNSIDVLFLPWELGRTDCYSVMYRAI